MACPLFIPSSPLGDFVPIAPPLGDLYGGDCAADPSAVIAPDTLRRYCNFGYARGHCERADQSEADAARFLIKGERGGLVEIAWATERNHHPVAVGAVEVVTMEIGPGQAAPASHADVLTRQAHACAEAYVRQSSGRPADKRRMSGHAHP